VQRESSHWWLRLELTNVHIVLHRHLEDSVASSLCLHLHCAPCLRNLHSNHSITHWGNRLQVSKQGQAIMLQLRSTQWSVWTTKSTVAWAVMSRSPTELQWHFRGTYCLWLYRLKGNPRKHYHGLFNDLCVPLEVWHFWTTQKTNVFKHYVLPRKRV
jgi:hypothetical protein